MMMLMIMLINIMMIMTTFLSGGACREQQCARRLRHRCRAASQVFYHCVLCLCSFVFVFLCVCVCVPLCLCSFLVANQVYDLCVEDDDVLDTLRVTGSEVRVGNNVTILSFSLRVTCTRSSFWGANAIAINIIITIVITKINKKT